MFAKENYCIKPFLLKLKNRDFKLLTGTYAFMKKTHTKNSTPTRFSTDWFGTIAENIVSVHALMAAGSTGTSFLCCYRHCVTLTAVPTHCYFSPGEPDTGYQAHSSVAAAREHVFHKATTGSSAAEEEERWVSTYSSSSASMPE